MGPTTAPESGRSANPPTWGGFAVEDLRKLHAAAADDAEFWSSAASRSIMWLSAGDTQL